MSLTVGTYIIIFRKPEKWSSGLDGLRPMDLQYPVKGVVVQTDHDDTVNIKIDDDVYGFSINYLIEYDTITL